MEMQRGKKSKNTVEEEKVREFILPDTTFYFKAVDLKQCGLGPKMEK